MKNKSQIINTFVTLETEEWVLFVDLLCKVYKLYKSSAKYVNFEDPVVS